MEDLSSRLKLLPPRGAAPNAVYSHFQCCSLLVSDPIPIVLKTDSEVLAILQQSFPNMLKAREPKQIDITCFFEQKKVPFVGYVSSKSNSSICK
jgi:hypothetical protein